MQVLKSRDYIVVYEKETSVVGMSPDESALHATRVSGGLGGVVVTAPVSSRPGVDFVSRSVEVKCEASDGPWDQN